MIKEAIEFIREKTLADRRPEFIRRPGDPPQIVMLVDGSGAVTKQIIEPPNLRHRMERIDDLMKYAVERADCERNNDPAVFYDAQNVTLVLNEPDGYNQVHVVLVKSPEYEFFTARVRQPEVGVKELRGALRYLLRRAFDDAKLVEQVSSLDISGNMNRQETVGRGKESIGQSILAEAKAAAGMPEERQVFRVRRWANADLDSRFDLEFILDPAVNGTSWLVIPQADSLYELEKLALDHIHARLMNGLEGTEIPIYRGTWQTAS